MLTARPPKIQPATTRQRLILRTEKTSAQSDRKMDLRHESKQRKREFRNLLSIDNATKHLDHLPALGCSIHGIMRGNFSYCDMIPAVLRLAAPATLVYVAITTLGFSRRATSTVLSLIDAGQVDRVDFVCADFFEKADAEVCQDMRASLTARGSRFVAARCHAKILLFETTAGQWFTSESFANILACRSIEQFCLTNDRELFEFHRDWIAGLFDGKAEASWARTDR